MSSLGLSSRAAAALAYSGWWVTGTILWIVERRDPVVRVHAAQAVVVFGSAALLWGVTMWKVARGDEWRIPVAARFVDRLATSSQPASA